MDNTKCPTYNSKEALVLDLKDFICRCPARVTQFNTAIQSAIEGAPRDMGDEKIEDLDGFLKFCEKILRWVPKVDSTGDELLRKILVFYWVFDQTSVLDLQTRISPETSNTDLSWLSYWLVSFARQQGQFLDTPESAGAVYTFYLNPTYNEEACLWEQPKTGWLSFNHWFARSWKNINLARPIDSPYDDKVITMPADSTYDNNWLIENGEVDLKMKMNIKGVEYNNWPIKDLLRTTATTWDNGHFTHSFLGPSDYHRQHAPVGGKVIEARVIQNQVYLQVTKKTTTGKLYADRAMVRCPAEPKRRRGVRVQYESEGEENGDENSKSIKNEDLDAPDSPGYQWCQTRGLIVIQTEKYGKVAILPIGMAQVSSVVLRVHEGQTIKKGDEISYFQFGGSDCVMVFERRVEFKQLPPKCKWVAVRKQIATFLD